MLSKKHYSNFINKYEDISNLNVVLKQIINIEKETGIEFLKWGEEQQKKFLKGFNAISPTSLNRYNTILTDFAKFVCTAEDLPFVEYKIKDGNFEELIDIEALLSVTLSYQQYRYIRNQLSIVHNGIECNIRDKVIFELAWEGLTRDEIRMLKTSNIKEGKNEFDFDIFILFLHTDRIVRIEDPDTVEDIRKCMLEKTYVVKTKNNVVKEMNYKDSDFLIKPVHVGRSKKEDYLDNPGGTLQKVFKSNNIICPGIDMDELSIEDIRRSKMVYLLLPENQEYFDRETTTAIFNLKGSSQLTWLRRIADIKSKQNDL